MSSFKPEAQYESVINTIRGKNLVGHATKEEVSKLIEHIDALEQWLDKLDLEDFFGTEGWRHHVGIGDDE